MTEGSVNGDSDNRGSTVCTFHNDIHAYGSIPRE